jgi:hypothetical protein
MFRISGVSSSDGWHSFGVEMPKASVDAAEKATSAEWEKAALACSGPGLKLVPLVPVELLNERHFFLTG